jgi:hypothetical protein
VREHPLAVLDFPARQTPRVGPIQAGRMALEMTQSGVAAARTIDTGHEANDHEDDDSPAA